MDTTTESVATGVDLNTLRHSRYTADMRILIDDDDYDRRPQRRRYEEPAHVKVRKLLLGIAESVRLARTRPINTVC